MTIERWSCRTDSRLGLLLIVAFATACRSKDMESTSETAPSETASSERRTERVFGGNEEYAEVSAPNDALEMVGNERWEEVGGEGDWGVNPEALAVIRELQGRDDCSEEVLSSLESHLLALCQIEEGAETDEDLFPLVDALAASGLTSRVEFVTERPGAVIRYRLITSTGAETATQFSNTVETLKIGHYYVWAERQGRPSSDAKRRCRIIDKQKRIDLEEFD